MIIKPKLEIEEDVGDVIIENVDGSTIHFFKPTENDFFDDSGEIRKELVSNMEAHFGGFKDIIEDFTEDMSSGWPYTVDSKLYISEKYRINVINDEHSYGASAGTEQILLSLVESVSSGAVESLVKWVLNLIVNVEGNHNRTWTESKIFNKVKKLLYKQFGAAGDITFSSLDKKDGIYYLTATDLRGQEYHVVISEKEGILKIIVNPPNQKRMV